MHLEEKNINFTKTKGVVPRGHSVLLLLFFENKRRVHNEVGTWEIFSNAPLE